MYKNKKILCLIPARGGSKGLPGKNLRLLSGKPLIAWTIKRALESRFLDKVVVSTDDKNITDAARGEGAEVPFIRPAELASDTATSYDVINHAIGYLSERGENYDYLALLEPTSPLRAKNDIDKAIASLIDREKEFDSLVSLGKIALENPNYTKKIGENEVVSSYIETGKKVTRRQDLPAAYFPYGVIYLAKIEPLVEKKTFYQEKTLSYLIERWQNYEVDDRYDFECIQAIFNLKEGEMV